MLQFLRILNLAHLPCISQADSQLRHGECMRPMMLAGRTVVYRSALLTIIWLNLRRAPLSVDGKATGPTPVAAGGCS